MTNVAKQNTENQMGICQWIVVDENWHLILTEKRAGQFSFTFSYFDQFLNVLVTSRPSLTVFKDSDLI